jgi:hypothetical protein
VPEEAPHTSDWRHTALFTGEDVESAVRRAGQAVYGSDERLDHLVRETRRFLEQQRRCQRPSYGEGGPDDLEVKADNLEETVRLLVVAVGELQHRLTAIDGRKLRWPGNRYEPTDLPPEVSGEA